MLNKSVLAKQLESVLNQDLPSDLNEIKKIKKNNKKKAKMIADSVDKFVKSASIDVKGIQTLPGTKVTLNPGQPVVNAPPIAGGAGATSGPGTGLTNSPAKMNPGTGINCGKVY
jgi:hypothetical protein|tara:strand:- start:11887 stop:12228 length:342 start_codon:yes stop_codon:yes gene_type:complete